MGELPPQKEECRRSIKTAHTHAHTHTYAFWSSSSLPMWWLIFFSTPTLEPIMSSWSSCACISSWRQNNKQSHQHSVSSTHNAVHQEQQTRLLVGQYVHTLDTLSMEPRDMSSWRQSNKQGHSAQFPAWWYGSLYGPAGHPKAATASEAEHQTISIWGRTSNHQHLKAEHKTISIWRQNIKPSASEGRTSNHHIKPSIFACT